MEFCVTIEAFEGPLDLMLHLIRQHKLDLFDLDMAELAIQYIAYIHNMQSLHLEVASEYLEELAGLVEYKSRRLLPRSEEETQDEYEEDNRAQLVARLLEYQAYKEAGTLLKDRWEMRSLKLDRDPDPRIEAWRRPVEEPLEGESSLDLARAMERVLRRHAVLNPYQTKITTRQVSPQQRQIQILARLKETPETTFEALCEDCGDLYLVVVTFLALLDLMHEGKIDSEQKGDIIYVHGTGRS